MSSCVEVSSALSAVISAIVPSCWRGDGRCSAYLRRRRTDVRCERARPRRARLWVVCVPRGSSVMRGWENPARDLYRTMAVRVKRTGAPHGKRDCTGLEDAGWDVGVGYAVLARALTADVAVVADEVACLAAITCARFSSCRPALSATLSHAEPPSIVHFGHRLLGDCRAPLRRRPRTSHAAARAAHHMLRASATTSRGRGLHG